MVVSGLITGAHNSLLVKGQRKLSKAEDCEKFNEMLAKKLLALEGAGKTGIEFEDFDVSQNKIPVEQFETLFATLSTVPVKVTRMKVFGCPTLNDQVCEYIASWLGQVTAETVPNEMHLSDCAITAAGFNAIIDAIESNDAFPPKAKWGNNPIYMRIEGNFIPEDIIKEKIEAGIIGQFKKNHKGGGKGFAEIPETARAKLLVTTPNKFAQKSGEPPAPEDAPPPKPVQSWHDWQKEKTWGGASNWWPSSSPSPSAWGGENWSGWSSSKSWPAVPAGQSQAGKGNSSSPQTIPPPRARVAGTATPIGTRATPITPMTSSGVPKVVKAADRSRTPATRVPPPARGPKALPPDWQEEWSDEYQIPFFWNSKTGESVWERPTA